MSKHLTRQQIISRITGNLQEFGYTDLTPAFVQEQVKAILDRNERPKGIIAQFALTMLIEAGYAPEREDTPNGL